MRVSTVERLDRAHFALALDAEMAE